MCSRLNCKAQLLAAKRGPLTAFLPVCLPGPPLGVTGGAGEEHVLIPVLWEELAQTLIPSPATTCCSRQCLEALALRFLLLHTLHQAAGAAAAPTTMSEKGNCF